MNERLAALEQRLARAERELVTTREQVRTLHQNQRQAAFRTRWAGAAGALGLAVSLILVGTRPGAAQSTAAAGGLHRIRAPFSVVGRDGDPIWRVQEGPGGGQLELFDRGGKRILLASDQSTFRGLRVLDPNGLTATCMGVRITPVGALRSVAAHHADGTVAAALEHGDGIGGGRDGSGVAVFQEGTGRRLLKVGTDPSDDSLGLKINDPFNDVDEALRLGIRQPDGLGPRLRGLHVSDRQGRETVLLDAGDDSGEIILLDQDGDVVFQAP